MNIHEIKIPSYDGTQIAVQYTARRKQACVLVNGLGGRITAYARIVEALEDRYQFFCWDYRGLFHSQNPEDPSRLRIRDHVEDLQALLDHFDIRSALVVGWSLGVVVTLEGYRHFPDRYQAIVLLNGTEGRIVSTLTPSPLLKPLLLKIIHHLRENHAKVTQTLQWVLRKKWFPYLLPYIGLAQKNQDVFLSLMKDYIGLDTSTFFDILLQANGHTAEPVLPTIAVPTLIIGGGKDLMSPAQKVQAMARKIPSAQCFILKNASHYALLEYPAEVLERIESFLKRVPKEPSFKK